MGGDGDAGEDDEEEETKAGGDGEAAEDDEEPVNFMTRLYEDERFVQEKVLLEEQIIDASQVAALIGSTTDALAQEAGITKSLAHALLLKNS